LVTYLVDLAYLFGVRSQVGAALDSFGCPACNDLITGGSAVATLDNGPIAQSGVTYAIIDVLVRHRRERA
jgi:hypothetical protein